MSDLEFYAFDPAVKPELVFSNFIFTNTEHLMLQSKKHWKVFALAAKGNILVQLSVHRSSKKAISPLRAPFGSLQMTNEISSSQLDYFVKNVLASLSESGVESITITNFPSAYHEKHTALIAHCLSANGFTTREQVSSVIEVNEVDYEKKIKPSERQKLKKSRAQFVFGQLPIKKLKAVYSFIEACRHERNQTLSMSLAQLSKTVKAFPNDFFLFEVKNSQATAAAAIVIRVNQKILYTFYYAHRKSFDKISPVVFLLSGIYHFAKENKYELIDLGTSMTGASINHALLQFKKSVGAATNRKLIFEKILS